MKIAFYIPVMNIGGAEKVIVNLLKELSLSEVNQYFLITDIVNSSWIDQVDTRVDILNVNSHANLFNRLRNIKRAIKDNHIDLVVSHLTHSNVHMLLLRSFLSFKLIVVEHNITSDYINDIPRIGGVLKYLIQNLFNKADRVICVSNATKQDLLTYFKLPEEKCKVIYNPFDFEQIEQLSTSPINTDVALKIRNRKFMVTAARLEIQKNHIFLIEAVSNYLTANDFVLVLVGGGSQENAIKLKISELGLDDHVFLTGYESNPYPYIANAAALVHPARFEGFGLVLVEAIFLSTPVISMNFSTAYEILDNGRMGAIVTDKESMIKAIDQKFNLATVSNGFTQEVRERFKLKTISNYYDISFTQVM